MGCKERTDFRQNIWTFWTNWLHSGRNKSKFLAKKQILGVLLKDRGGISGRDGKRWCILWMYQHFSFTTHFHFYWTKLFFYFFSTTVNFPLVKYSATIYITIYVFPTTKWTMVSSPLLQLFLYCVYCVTHYHVSKNVLLTWIFSIFIV